MLSLTHSQAVYRAPGFSRREWIRAGGLSALGLGMGTLQHALAEKKTGPIGRAKSCLVLFLCGGPAQHETFDPKPDAPIEIRGPHDPIASSVPGIQISELLPKTARLMQHICLLRSVYTDDNAHSTSAYAMLTGRPHTPRQVEFAKPGFPNDHPSLPAMVRHTRADVGGLPASIYLPDDLYNDGGFTWPGQMGGFLGAAADPWLIQCEPQSDSFQIPGLSWPKELSADRFDDRKSLYQSLDRQLAFLPDEASLSATDEWNQRAFEMLATTRARKAFDLKEESADLRDRYGRSRFGQSMLLARRLIEAGVSLVQVNWTRLEGTANSGTWDTHGTHFEMMRNDLMPMTDQAYSTLLQDLIDRNLLDETLVLLVGEFGRTPRINGRGGRDHWGKVFSVALAGGGIRGGMVHGASDRLGGEPIEGRVTPADLTATVLSQLGVDPKLEIYDRLKRPFPLSEGRVISEIVG